MNSITPAVITRIAALPRSGWTNTRKANHPRRSRTGKSDGRNSLIRSPRRSMWLAR
jgi:hypothetical protein